MWTESHDKRKVRGVAERQTGGTLTLFPLLESIRDDMTIHIRKALLLTTCNMFQVPTRTPLQRCKGVTICSLKVDFGFEESRVSFFGTHYYQACSCISHHCPASLQNILSLPFYLRHEPNQPECYFLFFRTRLLQCQ